MVHVFCQNKSCKMIIHLSDTSYWNFSGEVKCAKCGAVTYVDIQNGQVVSAKKLR